MGRGAISSDKKVRSEKGEKTPPELEQMDELSMMGRVMKVEKQVSFDLSIYLSIYLSICPSIYCLCFFLFFFAFHYIQYIPIFLRLFSNHPGMK